MKKQPTFYITHGGGPCFWVDMAPMLGGEGFEPLRGYFEQFLSSLPEKPKAILMVTAHWEEALPTVSTSKNPPMLYDYYGFPEHTYHLQYPASGAPELAKKVRSLLSAKNIPSAENPTRGFDHGVFVPMMIIDPKAEIPLLMMSLQEDLDPADHIQIGEALAPLRDEGVLIIGSGSSYHNLREYFQKSKGEAATLFDNWLTRSVTSPEKEERYQQLLNWEAMPVARICHPREEHLLPLMVTVGAAGNSPATHDFSMTVAGKPLSCYRFG